MAAPTAAIVAAKAVSSAAAAATAKQKAIAHYGNEYYPRDILYFTFSFVGAAMIINVYSVLWAVWRRRSLARGDVVPQSAPKTGLARLPSAILTACRIFMFRWTVPEVNMYVLEIVLALLYFLATFLWTFLNTQNLYLKNYANRTGHIAAAQMPVIVALSMKNNIIGWATGLSHEKLNVMHRAVSRVILIQVWIHGWARVKINAPATINSLWRIEGYVAGIAYTILIAITIAPIRRRFYEMFFVFHTVLVIVYLVTTLLHCKGAGDFEYYIWPCFVIWGFDRACRYLRYIVLSNFESPNKSPAEIELLNHDTVRITTNRQVPFGWKAGQHMFLSFPSIGVFQSHPFTIASVSEGDKKSKMVWIIRTRDGFTGRLKDFADVKKGLTTTPVFMDGPYGAPPDITPFNTCVFIAGGSGITYTLPRLRELLLQAALRQACVRRIVFVWAVRHESHISWLSEEFSKAVASISSDVDVSLTAFVTSDGADDKDPRHELDDDSSSSSDPEKDAYDEKSSTGSLVKGLSVSSGRPDIYKILEDAVTKSSGPVSVDVSGPAPLVATVRKALSSSFASPLAVMKGAPTVQLNVESFTM